MKSLLRLFALIVGLLVGFTPAWPEGAAAGTVSHPHVHEYDEIVSPDMESASSLANRARVSLRNGNYKRATALCRKALQKDDDDIDIHLTYAECLEQQLAHQAEKDPQLFQKCVREWLIVYRNEVGDEKGMTLKGLNLLGTMWNDEHRGGIAAKHLKGLTGYLPRIWETDGRYLAKVLKPADTVVTGRVTRIK
ncbi:MAG: tetratricopeptide repeat protein [Cyanobacteria bacterium SZAS TMP-1]|nr:tetratricopeptide repeat protein [Cyanobacteria bacterium SZAS TMP-1]